MSHEAIYTWMYVLPKGELAEMEIALRTGRARRQPRGRGRSKGARIVGMTSISQRPAEAAGRKVPGHWEGDLVIGKAGKTAMGTLAGRTSRYLVPVALPDGRDSAAVKDAVIGSVAGMPAGLLRSITWDQGAEMALATDIPVYFARAHSPWERGTNENTNGLLREYFPKGTDITGDIRYLNTVADEINGRPRASFNSGHQQKCSQSCSSLIIPRITSAQLLPPVETSEHFGDGSGLAPLQSPRLATSARTVPSDERSSEFIEDVVLKPAAVCRWIFTLLGAAPGDTLDDLFPARVRWAGRGPGWRANLRLLGWETGQVVADMGGIPMNAPNDNAAPKGLRGWWLSPPRPGMQRLISPWEYRHLHAVANVRFAAGGFQLGIGLVLISLGRQAGTDAERRKMYRLSAWFLVPAVGNFLGGYWYTTIARSAPPRT